MNNKEQIEKELEECENLWSRYSCDCLGYAIDSLRKQLENFNK